MAATELGNGADMNTDFKMPVRVVNGGQPGGVATLDQDGKLPSEQLPEDIDAIVSGYIDGYLEDHPIEDMVDDWLEDHPEATTTVEDGAITVDKLAADALALIGSKVSPGDYAPMLRAGVADALSSSYGETETFAQRVSNYGGSVEIQSILGNTVVESGELVSVNISGIETTGRNIAPTDDPANPDANYESSGGGTTPVTYDSTVNMYTTANHRVLCFRNLPAGKWTLSATIKRNPAGTSQYCAIGTVSGVVFGLYVSQVTDQPLRYSFTFNVPENGTFKVVFYNAAFWDDIQMESGADATPYKERETHTYEIPASTYFPQGMRGAGSVHDELQNDKAVQRIGAVDLGTLTWEKYDVPQGTLFRAVHSDFKGGMENDNFICTRYPSKTMATRADKTISSAWPTYIDVIDDDYSDADTFKSAMSGVYLYYELNMPTTQTIDPPLNLTYPVEAGGTESIIVPTGSTSAAPTFVTLYAYDADGIIDKSQSIVAQVESGVASTNYAVNSYLVMRGVLYRVTSAIATGETITPGTNCTATTVMDEIVRLTA